MKCVYKYCKNGVLNPEEAIKTKSGYYHLECYEKREVKTNVFLLFCKYVTNDENGLYIKKKISDYIDKGDYEPLYVLFAMNYIVNHKKILHSIWGLKKYLDAQWMKNKYQDFINKYKRVQISAKEEYFEYVDKIKEGWGDMFG